ncbi:MAG: lanthionine synthetase LanC family protein [Lachnospiraceae bacterium]
MSKMEKSNIRLFPVRKAASPDEYLRAAIDAEGYIKTFQVETRDGIYWNEVKGSGELTFYRGAAGILYMYVQLYLITGETCYEEIIKKAARYLALHWQDIIIKAAKEGEIIDGIAQGLYMGIGGIGMVLAKVYGIFGDKNARKGLSAIIEYYMSHAHHVAAGVYWSDNSPLYLDGGIVLSLISAYEILGGSELLHLIKEAANYLISCGTYHEDGGLEINHISFEPKRDEPNFEFGTAGLGYLFGKVYEVTQDIRYLEAAKSAAKYITSISIRQEKGFLIPYKLTMEEPLYYLGSCHGPAGTAKLFYQLFRMTGNTAYYNQVLGLMDGMEALGAPLMQSPGYWNTYCVCCGPAGLLPLYIGLYMTDRRKQWLTLAKETGDILLGSMMAVRPGEVKWEFAFDRTKPFNLSAPIGFLNGSAGIAAMLLQLYALETRADEFRWERLVDDPFPQICIKTGEETDEI